MNNLYALLLFCLIAFSPQAFADTYEANPYGTQRNADDVTYYSKKIERYFKKASSSLRKMEKYKKRYEKKKRRSDKKKYKKYKKRYKKSAKYIKRYSKKIVRLWEKTASHRKRAKIFNWINKANKLGINVNYIVMTGKSEKEIRAGEDIYKRARSYCKPTREEIRGNFCRVINRDDIPGFNSKRPYSFDSRLAHSACLAGMADGHD